MYTNMHINMKVRDLSSGGEKPKKTKYGLL